MEFYTFPRTLAEVNSDSDSKLMHYIRSLDCDVDMGREAAVKSWRTLPPSLPVDPARIKEYLMVKTSSLKLLYTRVTTVQ